MEEKKDKHKSFVIFMAIREILVIVFAIFLIWGADRYFNRKYSDEYTEARMKQIEKRLVEHEELIGQIGLMMMANPASMKSGPFSSPMEEHGFSLKKGTVPQDNGE